MGELINYDVPERLMMGGTVSATMIDGEPWFMLNSLCRCLEIANPGNVAARIDRDLKRLEEVNTAGGTQRCVLVNEAGFYELVFRSDKPVAVEFRRWVTGEVLPQIRKTGGYMVPVSHAQALRMAADALDRAASETQRADRALQLAASETQRADRAQGRVQELEPAADAWDSISAVRGSWTFRYATSILRRRFPDMTISEFRSACFRVGIANWDYRKKVFVPNQAASRSGLVVFDNDGKPRITPRGLTLVYQDLSEGDDPQLTQEDRMVLEGELVG